MTEDRKPETPGMAEVSAKIEHEAEAAVGAEASTDEALFGLWQEHERLTAQYSEAVRQTDLAFVAKQAITETETPEYRTAATALEAANEHQQEVSDSVVVAENRMARMPARTIAGALLKLRVVGIEITGEFTGRDGTFDETTLGSVERLTLSALADLERLVGEAAEPGDPILALEREWKARWKRYKNDPDDDDELTTALGERVDEAHHAIIRTPATTIAGVAAKLAIWARGTTPGHAAEDWWKETLSESCELEFAPVASALQDLERMSGRAES